MGTGCAILSYSLWQRRFGGSRETIGQHLILRGKALHHRRYRGAQDFRLDGDEADMYTPLGQNTDARMQNRGAFFIHVLGRSSRGLGDTGARRRPRLQ